jgi:hypothetical protein
LEGSEEAVAEILGVMELSFSMVEELVFVTQLGPFYL